MGTQNPALSILLAVFTGTAFFVVSAFAESTVRQVDLAVIHPGQMEVGSAIVRDTLERALDQAEGDPARALTHLARKPVPAVIAPDGRVWIQDGHHRAAALELLSEAFAVQATLQVQIEADFSHPPRPWREFYEVLERDQKTYFTPEVRKKRISFQEKVAQIPATLKKLLTFDNPLRSVVGFVLKKSLQSNGSEFTHFIEFDLAESLAARGMHVKPGQETQPAVLEQATRLILNPEGVEFLRNHIKSAQEVPSAELPGIDQRITAALLYRHPPCLRDVRNMLQAQP